ncbi:hypothetical protein ACFLWR_03110 [Chloroflexota bacterium]
MAEEIKNMLDLDVDLIPIFDGQGKLDILVDDQVVFSGLELGRFPEDGEIVAFLKEYSPD